MGATPSGVAAEVDEAEVDESTGTSRVPVDEGATNGTPADAMAAMTEFKALSAVPVKLKSATRVVRGVTVEVMESTVVNVVTPTFEA